MEHGQAASGFFESKSLVFSLLVCIAIISAMSMNAYAVPVGPVVTLKGNLTPNATVATKVNSTVNGSSPGGYIFIMTMDIRQQNTRWKAYVGNVTGTFALDDANTNTFYQWSLTSIAGEVYSTRASGTVTWAQINCTWAAEGALRASLSNRTIEERENAALGHVNQDDNITATFDRTNHSSVTIGSIVVGKNQCFTLQTWQNDNEQSFSDSDDANFTQIIMYDGTNTTNGNVVYVTPIEANIEGFNSNLYDFQMIVPENAGIGFSSSTAYYFYVELS